MKNTKRIAAIAVAALSVATLSWGACTANIDADGHNVTNLADVNITDANTTGKLNHMVSAGDVRRYIEELYGL